MSVGLPEIDPAESRKSLLSTHEEIQVQRIKTDDDGTVVGHLALEAKFVWLDPKVIEASELRGGINLTKATAETPHKRAE